MTTQEKIGLVIKRLRINHHLSQEQLSCQSGIDQHYLSNIECGQRSVSVKIVERVAVFFGLSLAQFFTLVDNIRDQSSLASPGIVFKSVEKDFVRFLKEQCLSERTIRKYSVDTPNSPSVQSIIKSETGLTNNMYRISDLAVLDRIIARVSNSDFDRIGHSMYSAGLKKYKAFLES